MVKNLNMNRLKLKWKIFMLLLGFCALLLAILWIFQTVLLDTFYMKIRVSEIKRDADEIIAYIDGEAAPGDIGDMLTGISEDGDFIAYVTDWEGNSLIPGFAIPEPRAAEESGKLIANARSTGGEYFEYSSPDDAPHRPGGRMPARPAMQSLVYVKLAENSAGEEYSVIIRAVVSPVDATVTTLRWQLCVISGIMMILSVCLAISLAKRVSKPIEVINISAATLAKGDYGVHFNGKGFYEIVALSETLNATARELGKVEELRRELLANVSHDLRTPLALIYSYAEMMHDFPGEITPEQPGTIMDETRRLTTLVNDVLDLSKMESGMGLPDMSSFNLTESIAVSINRMNELLKKDGYFISYSYGGEVYVTADEAQIGRAFYNLLINAVNYTGDDRRVSVEQTISGDFVRISVTDSGEGISGEALPFIWDRYYKSGKSHRRAVIGTGLGLSIVKKIIETHGGRYGVQSDPGRGSVFWFEIGLDKTGA